MNNPHTIKLRIYEIAISYILNDIGVNNKLSYQSINSYDNRAVHIFTSRGLSASPYMMMCVK